MQENEASKFVNFMYSVVYPSSPIWKLLGYAVGVTIEFYSLRVMPQYQIQL